MKVFIVAIILVATFFGGGGYLAGIERGEINTTISAYETLTECAQEGDTATFAVEVDADGRLSRYECITGVRQNYSYMHELMRETGPVMFIPNTGSMSISESSVDPVW